MDLLVVLELCLKLELMKLRLVLIRNIVERMESYASKGNDVFTTDRKSVVLDQEKHTTSVIKKKKDGCCN